jgi:hypothetical protein
VSSIIIIYWLYNKSTKSYEFKTLPVIPIPANVLIILEAFVYKLEKAISDISSFESNSSPSPSVGS